MTTTAINAYGVVFQIPDYEELSIEHPLRENAGWVSQAFAVTSVTGVIHRGLDNPCAEVPVRPVLPGRVVYTYTKGYDAPGLQWDGSPGGYGNQVTVEHTLEDGSVIYSHYAHLKGVWVVVGQWVDLATILGPAYTTGISSGIHLHWEMRRADNPPLAGYWGTTRFDPAKYIGREVEVDELPGFTDDEKDRLHRLAAREKPLRAIADHKTGGGVEFATALPSLVYLGSEGKAELLALLGGRVPEHTHPYAATDHGHPLEEHAHPLQEHTHPAPPELAAIVARLAADEQAIGELQTSTELWRAVVGEIRQLESHAVRMACVAFLVRLLRDNVIARGNVDGEGAWKPRHLWIDGKAPATARGGQV